MNPFEDEYGLTGAIPWVYRQLNGSWWWYIEWWTTEEKARASCPEGYTFRKYNGGICNEH